jgi:hypothetical protein
VGAREAEEHVYAPKQVWVKGRPLRKLKPACSSSRHSAARYGRAWWPPLWCCAVRRPRRTSPPLPPCVTAARPRTGTPDSGAVSWPGARLALWAVGLAERDVQLHTWLRSA